MSDRWFRLFLVFTVVVTIGSMATLAERVVGTDSLLQPMDIVFREVRVQYFLPWSAYLVLATILSVLYWRFGRL